MGRGNPHLETSNYNLMKGRKQDALFYTIHRARVQDVHIDRGTMEVQLETISGYAREVVIPLLGLSLPPRTSESDANYDRSSWGRYIPQVGDMVLVGFDSAGQMYCLGYHAVFYGAFGLYDNANETDGGIGWGAASGKDLKAGDWDFKTARGAQFYMGNKVTILAGSMSTIWNPGTNEIYTGSTLIKEKVGEASLIRRGTGRRQILPTDAEEADIPTLRGTSCQEINNSVRYGSLANPFGAELARTSMGDVIDDTLKTPMLSASSQPVRLYEYAADNTGVLPVYEKMVDTGGNYELTANTATVFQWSTPLASWDISNLNTTVSATATLGLESPLVTIDSTISTIVDSPLIQLGSSSAVSGAVLGIPFQSSLTTFLNTFTSTMTPLVTAMGVAATAAAAINPPAGTAFGALATAFGALQADITAMLTTLTSPSSVSAKTLLE